jgi:hypothetical protein
MDRVEYIWLKSGDLLTDNATVNEIIGDHNVDKQMTDQIGNL